MAGIAGFYQSEIENGKKSDAQEGRKEGLLMAAIRREPGIRVAPVKPAAAKPAPKRKPKKVEA